MTSYFDRVTEPLARKRHLTRDTRAQLDLCARSAVFNGVDRLRRVARDIEHGLDQLFAIAFHGGKARVVVPPQPNARKL